MFRTVSLVLCFVAVSHQFNIKNFNVPSAVEVDSDAELSCEHDAAASSITKWWWKPAGPDGGQHLIYQYFRGGDGHQQVHIPRTEPQLNITIKTEGEDNLLLWALQPEHSGAFECVVLEETGDYTERKNSSDLVVYNLGSGPQLKFEEEEDVVVTCEAVGVAPEPDISISYDSNTYNTTLIVGPLDGLYNVSTNATVPREGIEGSEITCKLSFKDSDIPLTGLLEISEVYHSDAWLASTAAAPADSTEVQATLEANQTMPDSAVRSGCAWAALAALAIPLHLRAIL